MKLQLHIVTSKFGRRMFFVFFLCALIPVCGLAVIAYQHVNQQLDEQFHARLKRTVKTYSLFFYERFLILETEMTLAATHLSKPIDNLSASMEKSFLNRLQNRFSAMSLLKEGGDARFLFGRFGNLEAFNEKEVNHLKTGHSLVKSISDSGGKSDLIMILQLDSNKPQAGFLVGKINPVYLLALNREYHLPRNTDLIVKGESRNLLFSSLSQDSQLPSNFFSKTVDRSTGDFEFKWKNENYLACFRWIFMEPKFLIPGFNITFIQSENEALLQLVEFKRIFPQVILLAVLVSAFLSVYFIRKNLTPLRFLKEGTHQIAARKFNHRVEIESRDEFEELGESFNQMALQLNDQFNLLETSSEITHAVLSSLEAEHILNTVVTRMKDCFSCLAIGIGIVNNEQEGKIACHIAGNQGENGIQKFDSKLLPADSIRLQNNPEFLVFDHDHHPPGYLSVLNSDGVRAYLVLPIFLDSDLAAVLSLAYRDLAVLNHDRIRGRQMADQVAVALSNSRLLDKLSRLNWGTLRALARAVDAKSPWTAGHSERVTRLTLKLADRLIPDPKERENLHRAALLHDIGKLGIPAAVLDKPGKLSEQEYETIKKHPQIGARILEPIEEYAVLIPMVLHHHERFDGKGYPDGISGNSIPFGARILAVADVFDAMKSDRPYRKGMPLERVMGIMQEEIGRQFDPLVVEALMEIIYRKTPKAA
jgi:putative nucleotidyltransferase with HDIG domain